MDLDTHNQRDVCMMYVAEQDPTEKNGITFLEVTEHYRRVVIVHHIT